MFEYDGKRVAGLMGHMQEGQPTAWATSCSVADADDTAQKVTAAGGTVVVAPMDVTDLGRMAVFADPTGAVFGVWQPRAFTGADLVNEPPSRSRGTRSTRATPTPTRPSTTPSSAGLRANPNSRVRPTPTPCGSSRGRMWAA